MKWKGPCLATIAVLVVSNGVWAYKAATLFVGLNYTQMNLESEICTKSFLASLVVDAKISQQKFFEIMRTGGFSGVTQDQNNTINVGGNVYVFDRGILVEVR